MSKAAAAQYPQGVIVGGMADGNIFVWDAAAVMKGAGEHATIAFIDRHQAAVRALAFNPHVSAQHLIAAGSADGDISIINLETPGAPTIATCVGGG